MFKLQKTTDDVIYSYNVHIVYRKNGLHVVNYRGNNNSDIKKKTCQTIWWPHIGKRLHTLSTFKREESTINPVNLKQKILNY